MSKQKYLFFLVQDYLNFRLPEILSICELLNLPNCMQNYTYSAKNPFLICNLEKHEIAKRISERSVLIRSVHSLIYECNSFENMLSTIRNNVLSEQMKEGDSFKITVQCFNKKIQQSEKVERIEKLIDELKFEKYTICLNDDQVMHNFYYFEEWADDSKDNKIKYLKNCYFTKFISYGLNSITHKFNLSDRSFIANTSMDPWLAFIMSNMGKVKKGDIVFDPFVGSGSLLVSSAYHGAHVMGADLDFNLLHSIGASSRKGQKYRKKEESIRNNLKQYSLEDKYIDVIVADSSSSYITESILFDAIITDPPYGIREKTKRIGDKKKKQEEKENNDNEADNSSPKKGPQCTQYFLSDVYTDLLEFASKHLVEDGRLTFWLPIHIEGRQNMTNEEELIEKFKTFIPRHPKLKLIDFSEQNLSMHTSRLMVTMEYSSKLEELNAKTENETSHIESLDSFRDKYFGKK